MSSAAGQPKVSRDSTPPRNPPSQPAGTHGTLGGRATMLLEWIVQCPKDSEARALTSRVLSFLAASHGIPLNFCPAGRPPTPRLACTRPLRCFWRRERCRCRWRSSARRRRTWQGRPRCQAEHRRRRAAKRPGSGRQAGRCEHRWRADKEGARRCVERGCRCAGESALLPLRRGGTWSFCPDLPLISFI